MRAESVLFMNKPYDIIHHGHLEVASIDDGVSITVIGGRLKVSGSVGSNVTIKQYFELPASCMCRFFTQLNPCATVLVDDRAGVIADGPMGSGVVIDSQGGVRGVSCDASASIRSGGNIEVNNIGNRSSLTATGSIVTSSSGKYTQLNARGRISCDQLLDHAKAHSKLEDILIVNAHTASYAKAKTNLSVAYAFNRAQLIASDKIFCNRSDPHASLSASHVSTGYVQLPTELQAADVDGNYVSQVAPGLTASGSLFVIEFEDGYV